MRHDLRKAHLKQAEIKVNLCQYIIREFETGNQEITPNMYTNALLDLDYWKKAIQQIKDSYK